MLTNRLFIHKDLSADFSFGIVGAKEKSIKKKSAEYRGLRPSTPPPFEKGGRKLFSLGVGERVELTRGFSYLLRC